MKNKILLFLIAGILSLCTISCDKEEDIQPSEEYGINEMFTPGDNEPQIVKDIYNQHDVWVRMDYENPQEVANAILIKDDFVYARKWVEKIEDPYRKSAYKYMEKLFSIFPAEFTRKHFPVDIFIVKSFGKYWWAYDVQNIGRSRFVLTWPNQMQGALPVDTLNYENHFYQDAELARSVLSGLLNICSARFGENEGLRIQQAGWAYTAEYMDNLKEMYPRTSSAEYKAGAAKIAKDGGFIEGSGSRSFQTDINQWMLAISTNSEAEMKEKYLDNSPKRAAKYKEVIQFFKDKQWDIQATGNLYSKMVQEHKLPEVK